MPCCPKKRLSWRRKGLAVRARGRVETAKRGYEGENEKNISPKKRKIPGENEKKLGPLKRRARLEKKAVGKMRCEHTDEDSGCYQHRL